MDAEVVETVYGDLDERQEMQPQPVLTDDANDAEAGAPQRIGIARAGWLLADGEESGELVQLVGQRHGDRDRCGRHCVGRALRRVVVADGFGNKGVLIVMLRVVAAHHALQLGELADHAGHQVGLAEQRRGARQGRAGVHQWGDMPGQCLQPEGPVALATQFRMERHVVELGDTACQPRLAVEVPEMPRIGETGTQHPLVARDADGAAVGRGDIGDEGKIGCRRTVGVAQREVALVDPHGDLHDLGRQVHEGRVNPPEQRHRPFD